jgi:hypothetical protein
MKQKITIVFLLALMTGTLVVGQSPFSDAQDTLGIPGNPRTNGKLYESSRVSTLSDSKIGYWQWRVPFGVWADMVQSQVAPGDVLNGNRAVLQKLITPNPYSFNAGVSYQFRIYYPNGQPDGSACFSDIAIMQFQQALLPSNTIKLTVKAGIVQWNVDFVPKTITLILKKDGGGFPEVASIDPTRKTYQLPMNFTGQVHVDMITVSGSAVFSPTIYIRNGTSIEIKACPNPAKNLINVFGASKLRIFDQTGRTVLITQAGVGVDISSLSAGIYTAVPMDYNNVPIGASIKFVKK